MPKTKRNGDADAFIRADRMRTRDDLAEGLAEDFLASATSGEEQGEISHERIVEEEEGGPFVPSSAKKEFARGVDASNPRDSVPEPFPTPNGVGSHPVTRGAPTRARRRST